MTVSTIDRFYGINGALAIKAPCRAATTANITLSGEQTIDDVALVADDRVVVQNQTNPVDNGIWNVGTGTWQRAADFDGNRDVVTGSLVFVLSGTANGNKFFRVTSTGSIVVGASNITFTESSNALAGVSTFWQTVLDDPDASTSLTTLGFSTFFKTLIASSTDDVLVNLLIGGWDELDGETGFKMETDNDELLSWKYWYNGSGNDQTIMTRHITRPRTTDVGAYERRAYADHAYPKASTNTSGGAHRLAGGIGKKFFTVTDYSTMTGAVLRFRVNSSLTDLTEGVNFNAETSNDVTATNIAAAINTADVIGNTGAAGVYSPYTVDAEANGAVVNLFPHPHQHQLDIAVTGSGVTATNTGDGEVSIGTNSFNAFYRGGQTSNSATPTINMIAQKFGSAAGDGFGPRFDAYIQSINGSFGSMSVIGTIECIRAGADNTGTWRITPRNAGSANVYYEFDTAAFHPAGNGVQDLGTSGQKWQTVYASTGTINTSDETLKEDIRPVSEREKAAFSKLKINAYRLKSNTDKIHIGLIAQRVIEAFESEGLNAFDYYLVEKDEHGKLSVCYNELILGMLSCNG